MRIVICFFIHLLCTTAFIGSAGLNYAFSADLYVFYPTDIRPKSLQTKINKLCPDINAVAFGRIVDFYRQIDKVPPHAVLSLKPVVTRKVLTKKQDYKSQIKGSHSGQYEEAYFLVSLNKPVNLKQLFNMKIGVLDILGRKAMQRFMNDLLETKVRLKRVIKIEDFLPMLTFKMADAIFVSQSTLKKMQKKSRQKLIVTSTGIKIGLAVTGIYQQSHNEITQCIAKLDKKTNALLGVDHWEIQP
jgi:hypothetical protein